MDPIVFKTFTDAQYATFFKAAEKKIENNAVGNGKQMIGTSAGDLLNVHPAEPQVTRSPCAQLKWLEDNTPYTFEAFVTLKHNEGHQGMEVRRKTDNTLVVRIRFPITGGDDADPYRQIPINHRRMMNSLIGFAMEQLV